MFSPIALDIARTQYRSNKRHSELGNTLIQDWNYLSLPLR